jgi:hypothetical protein
VDGFIAQTFSAQDAHARAYFTRLFSFPLIQVFLQDYGILYSRGAWHITRDQNRRFGIQELPQPVDFDVRETQGTVVPQRQWAQVRYNQFSYSLQLPVFFVHQNGGVGFSLSDILQGRDSGLYNGDEEAPLKGPITTYIRISVSLHAIILTTNVLIYLHRRPSQWPTYADWRQEIQIRDGTYARNPITRARLMKAVGRSVEKFFNVSSSFRCHRHRLSAPLDDHGEWPCGRSPMGNRGAWYYPKRCQDHWCYSCVLRDLDANHPAHQPCSLGA